VIGKALSNGAILYKEIWDNKPPLLYVIYALFNGDQFYVRLASLIVGLLSIVVFFHLAKKVFQNRASIIVSTIFYSVIFGLPLIEGNIANAENFMVLPILMSFYLMVGVQKKKKNFYAIISGVLLSIAFLIKIVAIFDLVALGLIIFTARFTEEISFNRRNIKREIKSAILGLETEARLVIAFAVPIVITAFYFLLMGAFSDFLRAALSQNVGYVGYGNYFLFPMGLLFIKLTLLLFTTLLIFRYRRFLGPGGELVFIWVAFSLFSALFSARPYTHYLLVLLPAASLLVGYIFETKKTRYVAIAFVLAIGFIVNRNFKMYTKILPYYVNYFKFISGGSVLSYQSFFDKNTPRDYELARFIMTKTRKDESVFLWGDNAQVYALSGKLPPGRYAVAYHITFYKDGIEETKKAIGKKSPKYIIEVKHSPEIENFLSNYTLLYTIDNVLIYERQP
jgi:hypothetical protein